MCFTSDYHTNMDRLSTTPSRNLIPHIIFSQSGLTRREYCLSSFKCLSQRHSDATPGWGNEPRESTTLRFPKTQRCNAGFEKRTARVDNLAVANLRFYLSSFTATSWDIALNVFLQRHNTALRAFVTPQWQSVELRVTRNWVRFPLLLT